MYIFVCLFILIPVCVLYFYSLKCLFSFSRTDQLDNFLSSACVGVCSVYVCICIEICTYINLFGFCIHTSISHIISFLIENNQIQGTDQLQSSFSGGGFSYSPPYQNGNGTYTFHIYPSHFFVEQEGRQATHKTKNLVHKVSYAISTA